MLKQTIFTLIGFLTIASAFDATFEDSLFYLNPANGLSTTLFQTRGGIIGYDINTTTYTGGYVLINLETKNTSVILSDIVAECNGTATDYDRLHYHVVTSSLLYYCLKNNSLLVIDQTTYTVELTIPTNVNTAFDEVKLIPQGYSLVVLGMIGVFTNTPGTSELITIDLQSQTVASHVVFNHGLSAGEAVVGYTASSQNSLYILTSTCIDTQSAEYKVTLYSMFLIGSSYSLNNISSSSYYLIYPYYPIMTELYSVGNLLVVSYNQTIDIVSTQGNVLGTVQGLQTYSYLNNNIQHVALAGQYGNSDFYALLQNSTLLKFDVQKGGYKAETLATGILDMQYVTSNLSSHSLLFTSDNTYLFNITDLQTSQPIYSTTTENPYFMTTDTTYAAVVPLDQMVLYVFSRETNLLIYQGPIVLNYYYDANSHLISYMDYTNSSQTQCHMVQFNIQTTNSYIPFVLDPSYGTDCPNYDLYNVTNDLDNPQFLLDIFGTLLVMSENYGLVNYGSYEYGNAGNIPLVDYDTLTVYIAVGQDQDPDSVKIYVSTFNPNNNTFTFQGATEVGKIPVFRFYALPGQVLIRGDLSSFELVDLTATLNKRVINTNAYINGDFFQDKTGAVYLMLYPYDVYYANQITKLPGITASTTGSSPAGLCRYTLTEQVNDFSIYRLFNVCPKGALLSGIYV